MKSILYMALGLVLMCCAPVRGQEGVTTREPKWKQLSQAYGFIIAQGYSLNRISTEFPDLAPSVKAANFAFMSTGLGEGANALEAELKQELADKWPETKGKMEEQYLQIAAQQPLTRDAAIQFIDEVNKRAKGEMVESIRNTLLATSPTYRRSPGAELAAGWRQNFSTLNHPKSAGANITIGLPLSWWKRESTRPGIVQVFRSGAGNGPILCNLSCNRILGDTDADATAEDMKEFFTEDSLKKMATPGATLIEARPMQIAGAPGGMMVLDLEQETLDVKTKMRSTTFMIIHRKHLVQVNFLIMGQFLKNMDFDEAQKAYFPTYRIIMATLVKN